MKLRIAKKVHGCRREGCGHNRQTVGRAFRRMFRHWRLAVRIARRDVPAFDRAYRDADAWIRSEVERARRLERLPEGLFD